MPKYVQMSLGLGVGSIVYDLISVIYSFLRHTTEPMHWGRAVGVTLISLPLFWLVYRNNKKDETPPSP
jgi:hypothetical protein